MASAPPAAAPDPINAFPAEAAPAVTPPEPSYDLSELEQDVKDVFAFEPTAPSNDQQPPAGPAPAPEPGGDGGQAPSSPPASPPTPSVAPQPAPPAAPASPPAAPPSPAPATPQPPADDPALRMASLEAQIAALSAANEQLRANPQPTGQQPQQPAAPGPEQPAEQPPRYNLSLPEQVTNALIGEDPVQATQAMHWVVNSLATIVHHNLRTEYRKHFDDRVNGLVAEAGQSAAEVQQATTIEQAREQYYQKFTDHKNPLIQPIVALEAQKLATQYPGLTWGDQFMDSLGARVNAALTELRGGQAAPAAQPVVPPARPAAMLPASGPAPQVPPVGGESQEDIMFSTMQDGSFW